MHTSTSRSALNQPLMGLDSPQVWNTELAFRHLHGMGQADSKRTAESRLHELAILPVELQTMNLLDELGRSPIPTVLSWQIEQARSKRKLVLFAQALSIGRQQREELNGHPGKVIWFTGLSGSGKSTLANALEVALHAQGKHTYLLDGDNLRQGLNRDLGFTDADRVENIRRIAEVGKLMMDAGLVVMTAFISPFRQERELARELIGPEYFTEVYVSTPLAVCEQRDAKGLYKKARSGQLPNMSGIGSPYEPPLAPQVTVDGSNFSIEECVHRLLLSLAS